MADVDFRLDVGGMRSVLKSGEMQAALGEIVAGKSAVANAVARAHHMPDVYGAHVDVGRYTAIGKVTVDMKVPGAYLEAKHHVLTSLNH